MNEFFTWDYLGSFAGVVVAVTLIIQFAKWPLDNVWKVPTRYVVWAVSYALLLVAAYFTVGVTLEKAVLSLFNAVLVAWTAMGAYEATFKKIEDKSLLK